MARLPVASSCTLVSEALQGMQPVLSIGLSGVEGDGASRLRHAVDAISAGLPFAIEWTSDAEAKSAHVLVVDVDTLYGHMDWMRAQAEGRALIALTSRPEGVHDHELDRNAGSDAVVALLAQFAPLARAQAAANAGRASSPRKSLGPAVTKEAPLSRSKISRSAPSISAFSPASVASAALRGRAPVAASPPAGEFSAPAAAALARPSAPPVPAATTSTLVPLAPVVAAVSPAIVPTAVPAKTPASNARSAKTPASAPVAPVRRAAKAVDPVAAVKDASAAVVSPTAASTSIATDPQPALPTPASSEAGPAPQLPAAPRDAMTLLDWLQAEDGIADIARLKLLDGTPLIVDRGRDQYYGPAALKPLLELTGRNLWRRAWYEFGRDSLDRERGDLPPQPLARLRLIAGIGSSNGSLRSALDPALPFHLPKWPKIEREFPRHMRIATALMKGPATIADLTSQLDMPAGEIADVLNGFEAAGFIGQQATASSPQTAAPAAAEGLLGRLRALGRGPGRGTP